MRSDIEFLKLSGFNMIRKHVKVEPRRYYYHCDVLGIMVWQDQVSGTEKEGDCFKVPPWSRLEPKPQEAEWPDWAQRQFLREMQEMVETLYNSPSIVVWVPFNEAWGQHDTMQIATWLRALDQTRLINIASGGNFFEVGDIVDHHNYPEPTFPGIEDSRFQPFIKVIGEFGGHGLVLGEEHLWQTARKNWGYDVLKERQGSWTGAHCSLSSVFVEFLLLSSLSVLFRCLFHWHLRLHDEKAGRHHSAKCYGASHSTAIELAYSCGDIP